MYLSARESWKPAQVISVIEANKPHPPIAIPHSPNWLLSAFISHGNQYDQNKKLTLGMHDMYFFPPPTDTDNL